MHIRERLYHFLHKLYICFMNLKTTHKLLIIYILVILMPTASLATALYHSSYISLQQSYYLNEETTLRNIRDNFIMQLNQISSMSYYFEQSDMLEPLLRGTYSNASETVYHFIKDVIPLIKATKVNHHVMSTNLYGFQHYYLNMPMSDGFSSIEYLDKDEAFISKLKYSRNGLWDFSYSNDKGPTLTFYKYLYTKNYPYDLGIVAIKANFSVMLTSLSNQVNRAIFISQSDSQPMILFDDKIFSITSSTMQEYMKNNPHSYILNFNDLNLSFVLPFIDMPKIDHYGNYFIFAIMILLVAFTALYFFFSASFSARLSVFNKHIISTDADNMTCFECPEYRDEVGHAISSYNKLVKKINQLINENYKIQLQSKDAQFYALQAQINPHFFYNILENIRMCAEEHKDYETSRLIQIFGDYMRYNLNSQLCIISLSEEMRSANNYLKVHKIIMGDSLVIDIGAYTDIDDVLCPRFILQPLLENALKHGRKTTGKFIISLSVHDALSYPEFVMVRITDNGVGISPDRIEHLKHIMNTHSLDDEHHVGLRNVNSRIISYSGIVEAGLKIDSQIGKGTTITFLLPKRHKDSQLSSLN
jgi:two-component system sensor histidine kinase YesM